MGTVEKNVIKLLLKNSSISSVMKEVASTEVH